MTASLAFCGDPASCRATARSLRGVASEARGTLRVLDRAPMQFFRGHWSVTFDERVSSARPFTRRLERDAEALADGLDALAEDLARVRRRLSRVRSRLVSLGAVSHDTVIDIHSLGGVDRDEYDAAVRELGDIRGLEETAQHNWLVVLGRHTEPDSLWTQMQDPALPTVPIVPIRAPGVGPRLPGGYPTRRGHEPYPGSGGHPRQPVLSGHPPPEEPPEGPPIGPPEGPPVGPRGGPDTEPPSGPSRHATPGPTRATEAHAHPGSPTEASPVDWQTTGLAVTGSALTGPGLTGPAPTGTAMTETAMTGTEHELGPLDITDPTLAGADLGLAGPFPSTFTDAATGLAISPPSHSPVDTPFGTGLDITGGPACGTSGTAVGAEAGILEPVDLEPALYETQIQPEVSPHGPR